MIQTAKGIIMAFMFGVRGRLVLASLECALERGADSYRMFALAWHPRVRGTLRHVYGGWMRSM